MLQILHNPRCGKSRNCIIFFKENNIEFEIINYLNNPLTSTEIKILLQKLNLKPLDLVRQKESIWISIYKGKSLTDDDIIIAMTKYPILIERPIVIQGKKAIIGRDINTLKQF
jgi:arsenate reductase